MSKEELDQLEAKAREGRDISDKVKNLDDALIALNRYDVQVNVTFAIDYVGIQINAREVSRYHFYGKRPICRSQLVEGLPEECRSAIKGVIERYLKKAREEFENL